MEEDAILQGGLHRPSEASPKAHDTVNPVVHALRKVPVATRDTVKKEITRLVGEGVLAKVTESTRWVPLLMIVTKPNGTLRICIDPWGPD